MQKLRKRLTLTSILAGDK